MEAELDSRFPVDIVRLIDPYKPGPSDAVPEAESSRAEVDSSDRLHSQFSHSEVEGDQEVSLPG